MPSVRLITLDPAHFHAALVQKQMYPQVAKQVHVYAPLGPDLLAHLQRIAGFNARAQDPTTWEVEAHAAPDFLERMLAERPGNVVVLSGRNHVKIDYILRAVEAGLNVLADKPWVLRAEDLPKLQRALDIASAKRLIAYDIMTERHEITNILQRELVHERDLFGETIKGSPDEPGLYMESVHYLLKQVAGGPPRRPPWYFDITRQGEGLNDVGTHLVDLAMWILFPDQAIDHARDIRILEGRRWPTVLTRDDYERVTGEKDFPVYLDEHRKNDRLEYYCNNSVTYTLRGVHVKLDVLWDFTPPPGAGDSHLAVARGTRADVEIRQGPEEKFRPELYVTGKARDAGAALQRKVAQLQGRYPGVGIENQGGRWRVTIPDQYRIGHEAHFAEVTQDFLRYLEDPSRLPTWETPNMLAKYFVTTGGIGA